MRCSKKDCASRMVNYVFLIKKPAMYELLIGLRYIRAKRRNGFISFISMVSILGIALGVAALIIVLSVMNGFQEEVRNRILSMAAHVQISGPNNALDDWRSAAKVASATTHVQGTAPYVYGQGLLTNGDQVKGTLVRGIDPAQEGSVNEVAQKLKIGKLADLVPGEFRTIIGWQLASELGVRVGEKITLITPQGQITPAGMIPRLKQFTVAGIFQADYYPYDSGLILLHIADAQKLFRMGDSVSGVRIKLDDLNLARHITRQISEALPNAYVSDWTRENPSYFQAVEIEKRMMFIILTLIVAVAAFNLVSTLVMVVTDKQADIAILRTLGASPGSIMKIFMVQGAVSGCIGTLAGVAGGVLVAANLNVIVPAIEHFFGTRFLPADVYLITEMPSKVLISDVSSIGLIALLLAFSATIFPSWQASRVNPAEALRYE